MKEKGNKIGWGGGGKVGRSFGRENQSKCRVWKKNKKNGKKRREREKKGRENIFTGRTGA